MITTSLITDDMWSDIPDDPEEAFLFLAEGARENLHSAFDSAASNSSPFSERDWRRQYVWELEAIANNLGIAGLYPAANVEQNDANYTTFEAHLTRIITRIKIAHRVKLKADSAQLSYTTKDEIRQSLEDIRDRVNKSNLSDVLKASLHKKVDAVEKELDNTRSSLWPFWTLAGALSFAATTVGVLADLPDAAATATAIIDKVHSEKSAEEAHERIRSSPRQIEHKPAKLITDQSDKPTVE